MEMHLLKCQKKYTGNTTDDLDTDGTITSPTLENMIGKSLACKDTFIDTLLLRVTWDFLMMYQLH